MFVSIDDLEKAEVRLSDLEANFGRDKAASDTEPVLIPDVSPEVTRGNILGASENLEKRVEMLTTLKQEPVIFAYERSIGKNDSVYSNFIELIHQAKQKVGRIIIKSASKNVGYATGFMVSERLLLTNWHVFKTIEDVSNSEIQFSYELDTLGNPGTATTFELQSDLFYHSNKELDYCFVAVSPVDIDGKVKLSEIGYIFLDPALGKLGNECQEALNIIHHPDGDYMQLSIRENLFIKITPVSIWYRTDTAPGSSGSPVFNDQWQVVALHHMGVGKKDAAGNYLDKDEQVIPAIDGKIDASKVVWEANEGMRISVILKDLFEKFPDNQLTNGLKIKPNAKHILEDIKQIPEINAASTIRAMEPNNRDSNVNISFPASLIEKNGVINITINQGIQDNAVNAGENITTTSVDENLELAEIKKLEQSVDFSNCKGYQSRFLGGNFDIALPQPQDEIKKFIARVSGTDSVTLKYYNYSTIFHAVRMMPIISGINVNGDPATRKDTTKRKDTWLRDTRISFDIQLNDSYYKNSGFDKGHMSRREDANWGLTAADAKRNADLTCMYTNACPQVAKINQSMMKGLWGILEQVVLEKGAAIETGHTAKISVFNGPIFKDSDPVYKGIQVPMDFYKIILWLTDRGDLKATAFVLSQTELVDDIDFEQLDLDQNTRFKEFQCSIKWLQEETKLDFSNLFDFDTFEGVKNEVAVKSPAEIIAHVNKHNE